MGLYRDAVSAIKDRVIEPDEVGTSSNPVKSANIEQADITSKTNPVLMASLRSGGGSGTEPDPYQGGISETISDIKTLRSDNLNPSTAWVDGSFTESSPVLVDEKIRLKTEGPWDGRIEGSLSEPLLKVVGLDTVLENMTLQNSGTGWTCRVDAGEAKVKNCAFTKGDLALIETSDRASIRDCDFDNSANLRLAGASEVIVSDCRFANQDFLIESRNNTTPANVTVSSLEITGGGVFDVRDGNRLVGGPIQVVSGYDNVYIDNYANVDLHVLSYSAGRYGLHVTGGSSDASIHGTVKGSGTRDLYFDNCSDVQFHGNADNVTFTSNATDVTVYADIPTGSITNNGTGCKVVN